MNNKNILFRISKKGYLVLPNILVRVYNSSGHPVSGRRISIGTFGMNYGVLPSQYTDSDGETEFNIDDYGDINIYVDGDEKVKRGPIRGSYRIELK